MQKKKAEYDKLLKQREYKRHQIYVTMELDHVVDGHPDFKFWPLKPNDGS